MTFISLDFTKMPENGQKVRDIGLITKNFAIKYLNRQIKPVKSWPKKQQVIMSENIANQYYRV